MCIRDSLKASPAYSMSRSTSNPSSGMPRESTPASNTSCASTLTPPIKPSTSSIGYGPLELLRSSGISRTDHQTRILSIVLSSESEIFVRSSEDLILGIPLRSRGRGYTASGDRARSADQPRIAQSELSKAPTELAREILLLYQLSAKRAQVARRHDLVARGFSAQVIRGFNLSTEDELAELEAELGGGDPNVLPDTWMKPV